MKGQNPPGLEQLRRAGLNSAPISVLTYQSKAVKKPSSEELYELLRQAKARNRSTDLTGMLIFQDDCFFQWLEGPSEALDSIWTSIQTDPRHKDIELLSRGRAHHRIFSEWDMRFASPDDAFGLVRSPPKPQTRLPTKLIDQAANLALEEQTDALQDGIEEVLRMGIDIMSIYAGLVEPIAHHLGDLWMEDRCSNAKISVALSCLQRAVRGVSTPRKPSVMSNNPRQILVTPPPGESHMLGVALVGDLYREGGWLVDAEFPSSANEAASIVQTRWFDAVAICTSDVFARGSRIDALAMMIQMLRRESTNPNLVIMVGGRIFAERPDLARLIGADASYSNYVHTLENTLQCFAGRETQTALC